MFNPTSKIKKLLADYGSYVYIHRDGVVIRERKTVKVDKNTNTTIEVYHIVPCVIDIYTINFKYDYNQDGYRPKIDKMTLQDGRLIANGFDHLSVQFNINYADSSNQNYPIRIVNFRKGEHTWQDINVSGLHYGSVEVEPNPDSKWNNCPSTSVRDYLHFQYSSGSSVVIHGELPEIEVDSVKQLTVSS